MGILNGGLAAVFGAAFSGIYLDGVLHRGLSDPIYDERGNITGYGGGADIPMKVQRDRVTEAMRRADGFTDKDVALIILTAPLGGIEITTDMEATDGHGARWKIGSADLDAAGSHWLCRGTPSASVAT
jgi:hypothetical protein